ncbi:MAG: YqiA/YcfP family alpha/beta fold hydrolase [Candidatus Promineifilaceae bacterium]|nr:YqiA/YcfP family alpha/beta fold hydrolase [Candidatus Promineifilaceae bacterium]
MTKQSIINLHGFGSLGGLENAKAQLFDQLFKSFAEIEFHSIDFTPTPKDFQYHTITGMINRLRQFILDFDHKRVSLIGSSQGALVALNYAHLFGDIEKMLLLAPALKYELDEDPQELEDWKLAQSIPVFHYGFEREIPLDYYHYQDGARYVVAPSPPAPILIIHGLHDDVIPISHSRQYAERYAGLVQLIEVDDNHRLLQQTALLDDQALTFFGPAHGS